MSRVLNGWVRYDDDDDDWGKRRRANMLYGPTPQYRCLRTVMPCSVYDYSVR